jgi:hypothetical protein
VLRLSFPKKPSLREGRPNGFLGRTTKQSSVIARRTPEWFSRADDEAIFFYDNRKEIEIASLAGLARNDGRILALREGRHHLSLREGRTTCHCEKDARMVFSGGRRSNLNHSFLSAQRLAKQFNYCCQIASPG